MPYVPPHLRNKQSDSASASEPAPSGSRPEGSSLPRNSSYGQRLESAPSGGFGRQQSSGLPRTSSSQSFHDGGRGGGYGRGAPVEPVFANWQPTQRVLSLSEETIQEIRQRFKVTVEVTPGQPKAAAPIESFQEMVSSNMVWLGTSPLDAPAARRSAPSWRYGIIEGFKQCILPVDRSDCAAAAISASLLPRSGVRFGGARKRQYVPSAACRICTPTFWRISFTTSTRSRRPSRRRGSRSRCRGATSWGVRRPEAAKQPRSRSP